MANQDALNRIKEQEQHRLTVLADARDRAEANGETETTVVEIRPGVSTKLCPTIAAAHEVLGPRKY